MTVKPESAAKSLKPVPESNTAGVGFKAELYGGGFGESPGPARIGRVLLAQDSAPQPVHKLNLPTGCGVGGTAKSLHFQFYGWLCVGKSFFYARLLRQTISIHRL